eukprot:jgi/Bigna1/89514/estExt_fgenesh1_pg.C_500112
MGELIRHRLFRESCVQSHGYAFVKDLSRLGRDMSRIVLVDNSPVAMAASVSNSIPILSYYDNRMDKELPKLLATLYQLKMGGNVPNCLRTSFPGFRKQIEDFIGISAPSSSSYIGGSCSYDYDCKNEDYQSTASEESLLNLSSSSTPSYREEVRAQQLSANRIRMEAMLPAKRQKKEEEWEAI